MSKHSCGAVSPWTLLLAAALAFELPGMASAAAGGVKAVVVRSWVYYEPKLEWDDLNANWGLYGSIPLQVDYTTLGGVASFTYQDLVNSGADVVVLSCCAGADMQLTESEIATVRQYAEAGHSLVGTSYLFYWQGLGIDNSALAPLFGLKDVVNLSVAPVYAQTGATVLAPDACAMSQMGATFIVAPPQVAVPPSSTWDSSNLAGATYLARSNDGGAVVTQYRGNGYTATYFSFMVEWHGVGHVNPVNARLLYNVLTCPQATVPVRNGSWGELKARYR